MTGKKKTVITATVIIAALAILSATICLIVVSNKKNDIGEIYFHQTELEHIKSNDDGTMYADNEILLVADETAKYKDIERLAKANGAEIVGWIEQTNDYQLQLSKVCNCAELEQVAATLLESDLIDDAYVNYAFAVSDDATHERDGFIYGEKWEDDLQDFNHWEKAENFKSWGIEAVNALAAWDVLDSHKSKVNPVMVGLFDSRFDTNHEDLGFAETFYNTNPVDNGVTYNNHGTHVAGTMAAMANNKEGICGVYPYGDGNLYGVSLNVNSNYIENQVTSMCYKIACAELILRNVKVINVSLGFGYSENPVIEYESPEWYEQVDFMESNAYILGDFLNRLLNKGYDFVIVNSAGNDSDRKNSIVYDSKYNSWNTVIDEKDYPDVFNRIIVVGAMDSDGSICDFSNGGERVDIYAPGEQIYSTMINSQYGNTYEKEGKQYPWSGTSMAAPHVSGVAAIVWSLNNNLTGAQVKEIVCSSHNMRFNSCDVVDAYIAAERAASTIGLSENNNSNNGGILCWVVSAKDAETKIENATVTVTNTQTGEKFSTTTDAYGHFELFVPEGKYTLVVQAEGYADFNWPNEKESHTEPIIVEKNKVNYLVSCINDWIKMSEKVEEPSTIELHANDLLTVTGTLSLEDYAINSKNKDTAIILNLTQPISCKLYDEFLGLDGEQRDISSVQVSLESAKYDLYKDKIVRISGTVEFSHTGHHVRDVVLTNCKIDIDVINDSSVFSHYKMVLAQHPVSTKHSFGEGKEFCLDTEYALNDIDNNGIPELIVKEDGSNYYVYSFDGNSVIPCGEFYWAYNNCLYEYNGNGIVVHDGGMGTLHLEYISLYKLINGSLEMSETIKSTESCSEEELINCLETYIPINDFHPVNDYSYLQ